MRLVPFVARVGVSLPLWLSLACSSAGELATVPGSTEPGREQADAPVAAATDEERAWEKAMAESKAGVSDLTLADLLERHWANGLERQPTWATQMGIHRWDDRLSDPSEGARQEGRAQRDAFLEEAKAIEVELKEIRSAFSALEDQQVEADNEFRSLTLQQSHHQCCRQPMRNHSSPSTSPRPPPCPAADRAPGG